MANLHAYKVRRAVHNVSKLGYNPNTVLYQHCSQKAPFCTFKYFMRFQGEPCFLSDRRCKQPWVHRCQRCFLPAFVFHSETLGWCCNCHTAPPCTGSASWKLQQKSSSTKGVGFHLYHTPCLWIQILLVSVKFKSLWKYKLRFLPWSSNAWVSSWPMTTPIPPKLRALHNK